MSKKPAKKLPELGDSTQTKPVEDKADKLGEINETPAERVNEAFLNQVDEQLSDLKVLDYDKDSNGNLDAVKELPVTTMDRLEYLREQYEEFKKVRKQNNERGLEIVMLKGRIAELEKAATPPKHKTESGISMDLWLQLKLHDDNGLKSCRHCGRRISEAMFDPKSDFCKDCS